jgi:methionyl-tRNA formyltransferase
MRSSAPLRVAFAGTPEFAVPTLLALERSSHQLVGVLTQPDRPRGRGRRLSPSPVKIAAGDLPLSQPAALEQPQDWSALLAWRPDVLVVAAYGLKLPQPLLDLPPLGCVNVHASLLPRWRGAAPIERALLAGDAESGITIMLMEAGLDTGPVLLERRIHIEPTDTAGSLGDRLAALAAPLLLEALEGLRSGALRAIAQPAEGVTYARKLEKREAIIEWRRPAVEIERQVRALNPRPVAETSWVDPAGRGESERLRVHAARLGPAVSPPSAGEAPGTVLATDSRQGTGFIRVRCGSGCLELLTLQRPGGAPLPAAAFTHGPHRLAPSALLGPRP